MYEISVFEKQNKWTNAHEKPTGIKLLLNQKTV